MLAPPLACVTWQSPGGEAHIVHASDARALVESWLRDPQCRIVGHNVAYDLAVIGEAFPDLLPLIFAAYAADRVTDTMLRQQLLDVAAGIYRGRVGEKGRWIVHKYSLDSLAKRCAGMQLQKDAWRLSYGEFIAVPLSEWPQRAKEVQARAAQRITALETSIIAGEIDADDVKEELEGLRSMVASDPRQCIVYPLDDARATLAVYLAQEKHADPYLADQYRQARGAMWLHLSSAWGLRTDEIGVDILRRETAAALKLVEADLIEFGLVRADGSRDTKAAKMRMIEICKRDRIVLRRTDTHVTGKGKCKKLDGTPVPDGDDACEEHVTLDAEACRNTEDDVLEDYEQLSTLKKVQSNDVAALEKGVFWPVHTKYGFAETGRTTSSKPNIQNLRGLAGIREAFIPRPGYVFVQCDYPTLELYTFAQCCVSWFGASRLAEALNAGKDPHLMLAATILRISYEEAIANKTRPDVVQARKLAKPGNFGFPGGMGPPKFVKTTRKGMKKREEFEALGLDDARAKTLRDEWIETWPESRPHFGRAKALCDNPSGKAFVESLFTKRYRGGASYCATANTGFQGLGVDCAKEAGWRIARAQYTEPASPLWNTRTVAFVHDEFILEAKEERAHEVGLELARLMVEGANVYLPDVPIPLAKMEPLAMRRWSKDAKPLYENGRLIPWAA